MVVPGSLQSGVIYLDEANGLWVQSKGVFFPMGGKELQNFSLQGTKKRVLAGSDSRSQAMG